MPLVTISEAARAVERDPTTVRRWIRTGRVPSYDGAQPSGGGRAPKLVEIADLLAYVSSIGQKPKSDEDKSDRAQRTVIGRAPDGYHPDALVQLARSDAKVARYEGKILALRAELDAALTLLDRARLDSTRAEQAAQDMKAARDNWEERYDAAQAELAALRQQLAPGVPWWRRLLPGPAPIAEIPQAK